MDTSSPATLDLDTTSPLYLAGYAAGRSSLLVSVELAPTTSNETPLQLVSKTPVVALAGPPVPFGPFQLSIFDLAPEVDVPPVLD